MDELSKPIEVFIRTNIRSGIEYDRELMDRILKEHGYTRPTPNPVGWPEKEIKRICIDVSRRYNESPHNGLKDDELIRCWLSDLLQALAAHQAAGKVVKWPPEKDTSNDKGHTYNEGKRVGYNQGRADAIRAYEQTKEIK